MLLGEALGEDEARESRPFVGRAGKFLDKMLASRRDPETNLPLSRADFVIANVVNCRPPGNDLTKAPWEHEAIARCSPYFEETLLKFKPRAILALGNQPLRRLTGEWGIEQLRGYIFETQWGPVIGTYHPSYIMRGKFPYARIFHQDVLKALYVARFGVPRAEKRYITHPTLADATRFLADYIAAGCPPLAFDIETPYSKVEKDEEMGLVIEDDISFQVILRISFAFRPFEAISLPWAPPFLDIIRDLLKSKGDKVVWNQSFDIPRVRYHVGDVGGRIYDGMEAWHFYEPSFPMGLKSVATHYCPDMPAWKLEAHSKPEWYNAADSDVALRCFNGVKIDLEKDGRWRTFERHFVDLGMVLGVMSQRGVLVDRALRIERRKELEGMAKAEVEALQPLIPVELKPKKVYKLGEDRLRKKGSWKEGSMIQVQRKEVVKDPKPPKEKKPPKPRVKKDPGSPTRKVGRKRATRGAPVEESQPQSTS